MEDARSRAYASAELTVEVLDYRLRKALPPLASLLRDADDAASVAQVLAEAEDVLAHWVEVVGTQTSSPAAALEGVRQAAALVRALRELDEQLDAEEA